MLVCVDDGGTSEFPYSVVLVGQVRPWGDTEGKSSVQGGSRCTESQK